MPLIHFGTEDSPSDKEKSQKGSGSCATGGNDSIKGGSGTAIVGE